jgi:hypothetical protein
MTLEQLLSPAVLEWNMKHDHLPDDVLIKEFNKWVAENEELINESVKNNKDKFERNFKKANPSLSWIKSNDDDDLQYEVTEDGKEVAVVRSAYTFINEVVIPERITCGKDSYKVTSIDAGAFQCCQSLTSVIIPNSVKSIEDSAFLTCTSLESMTIPNSVKTIGEDAFRGCRNLTSITIPNSVKSIGNGAFSGCGSLTSITIPNSVKSIGDYAFSGCESLTSITIPNSVMSIGDNAFSNCSSLTSITIPNNIKSIGDSAFSGCESLTSITIPNSVKSIGNYAFTGCSSLTSITIPNSVKSIGDEVFRDCYDLTSVTIPNSVTSIGERTFYACSSLAEVNIPNNVTRIEENTFSGCSALTEIAIPNSVTYIGESVFEDCVRLGKVQIGSGVETIAENAFAGCTRLYDVYCYATYPPFAEQSSFANYNVYLYVPCESIRNYTLDVVWGNFKFIECIESEDVTTDGVVITPSTNDVTITWPTEGNADTYTIVIKKGNEVFCTLTFNAEGQLLNIAFAPGRDGNHPAQYAEQAGNGYRFTVTGLEEGTQYAYNIDVKDAADKTIKSYTGEFTTESMTAVENPHSQSPTSDCQKILYEDHILILRDGKTYTIMGAEVK